MAATPAAAGPPLGLAKYSGLIATICGTLAALAAFAIALILFVRPFLKRMEKLADSFERSSEAFQETSAQLDKTCQMIQLDLPPALESAEKATKEFEELSLHLRIMTGGKRKPVPPKVAVPTAVLTPATSKDSDAKVESPASVPQRNSFQRVAQDVITLTHALEPALNQWRKRINSIAARFEHVQKQQAPDNPALSTSSPHLLSNGHRAAAEAASSAASSSSHESAPSSAASDKASATASSPNAETASPKAANNSNAARGSKSSPGVDKPHDERRASNAAASTSQGLKGKDQTKSSSSKEGKSQAELQGEMVRALVQDIGGSVSKASDKISQNDDEQPMTPELAANLTSEIVTKASASMKAFVNGLPDVGPDDKDKTSPSPEVAASIGDAADEADRIATDADRLVGDMGDSEEEAEERPALQAVSHRSKSAAKVFKALAHAEKATAAAVQASGVLESAVAEARKEGPLFEGLRPDTGNGKAASSTAQKSASK